MGAGSGRNIVRVGANDLPGFGRGQWHPWHPADNTQQLEHCGNSRIATDDMDTHHAFMPTDGHFRRIVARPGGAGGVIVCGRVRLMLLVSFLKLP